MHGYLKARRGKGAQWPNQSPVCRSIPGFKAMQPVWAPYYTLHKILVGLLDQYDIADNKLALELAEGLAGYIGKRLESVLKHKSLEHHWDTLNMEFGGMNDVLWRLAGITGSKDHRRWASLFDKPCFLGPLARGEDRVNKMHANTHIPIVIGAQTRHEITGEPIFRLLAENFLDMLNNTRTLATGGNSYHENWGEANMLGHTLGVPPLGTVHQESCTTHNTLRLTSNFFRWSTEPRYAEFMERLQLNGVLGTQRGSQPGQMLYFYPLGTGVSKHHAGIKLGSSGWSDPHNYFSCCMGTGIEAHAKLQENVFFHSQVATGASVLWVVSLVSSILTWEQQGLNVSLEVRGPGDVPSGGPSEAVITVTHLKTGTAPGTAPLHSLQVRVPRWARNAAAKVAASSGGGNGGLQAVSNGEVVATDPNADFWGFSIAQQATMKLQLQLPVALHTEPLRDPRCQYRDLKALLWGPLVLAGLTESQVELVGHADQLTDHMRPVPSTARQQLTSLRGHTGMVVAHNKHDIHLVHLSRPGYCERRRGGSVEANQATWRMVPSLRQGEVMLESFDLPNRFWAANDEGKLGLQTLQSSTPPSALYFRQHGKRKISLESVKLPGWYVGKAEGSQLQLVKSSRSALEFDMIESAADYPPASFWAEGHKGQHVLMWPLNEMVDELYTVYWRLCDPEGCPQLQSNTKAWKVEEGFLPQGEQLYQGTLQSIDDAKRLCMGNPKCTSFCFQCGPKGCKGNEPIGPVDVYYKSFQSPTAVLNPHKAWRSYYLTDSVDVHSAGKCDAGNGNSNQVHLSTYSQGNPFEKED